MPGRSLLWPLGLATIVTLYTTRPEFEAALARAYLAQGRRSAALRQIEHYLTLRPEDLDAQRFRSTLIFESKRGTPLK